VSNSYELVALRAVPARPLIDASNCKKMRFLRSIEQTIKRHEALLDVNYATVVFIREEDPHASGTIAIKPLQNQT